MMFLRYGAKKTDGWRDEQKKWHIEVGTPPKKNQYFEQSATLFEVKKKIKSNSLIQALAYKSNIYYSKIYQRGN